MLQTNIPKPVVNRPAKRKQKSKKYEAILKAHKKATDAKHALEDGAKPKKRRRSKAVNNDTFEKLVDRIVADAMSGKSELEHDQMRNEMKHMHDECDRIVQRLSELAPVYTEAEIIIRKYGSLFKRAQSTNCVERRILHQLANALRHAMTEINTLGQRYESRTELLHDLMARCEALSRINIKSGGSACSTGSALRSLIATRHSAYFKDEGDEQKQLVKLDSGADKGDSLLALIVGEGEDAGAIEIGMTAAKQQLSRAPQSYLKVSLARVGAHALATEEGSMARRAIGQKRTAKRARAAVSMLREMNRSELAALEQGEAAAMAAHAIEY